MNPLLKPSTLPFQLPDFAHISDSDVLPAAKEAMARHRDEIAAIASSSEEPTWENTIEAWERSGQDLDRVLGVFYNLVGPDATKERLEIDEELSPLVSAHFDEIWLNKALFDRVKRVEVPDDAESAVLYDKIMRDFKRAGIELPDEQQARLREINNQLSTLTTEFGANLLADTQARSISITDDDDLSGLSQQQQQAIRAAGEITLGLPTVQPIIEALENVDLARRIHEESLNRGRGSAGDNRSLILDIATLRAEKAELLGYKNHAEYVVEVETADSVDSVQKFLRDLAPAAEANAQAEKKLCSELAGHEVEPWEWPRYAEKVRERDYGLDTEKVKSYFPLSKVRDGAFRIAEDLYGITVSPREDLDGYVDSVDVYEISDSDSGESIGLFLTDYLDRSTKRGGAWMSSFVDQSHLLGFKPVVVNVMGIAPTSDGSEPLLTLDEVTTLFHEFGHALHGLLSSVRYPRLSGTNVPRDFVEFPSQINENWAFRPEVVKSYAEHVETGEPIPDDLIDAIGKAAQAGQGFGTSEYLAACVVDLAWHTLSLEEAKKLRDQGVEVIDEVESEALRSVGLSIQPRYRSTYFNHIFAGGYSAGYWSYLWAEALDADGFETLKAGPEQGRRFRELILSKGASIDYSSAYEEFAGHPRSIQALLTRRGLSGVMS